VYPNDFDKTLDFDQMMRRKFVVYRVFDLYIVPRCVITIQRFWRAYSARKLEDDSWVVFKWKYDALPNADVKGRNIF
jgi:hypothetical protein